MDEKLEKTIYERLKAQEAMTEEEQLDDLMRLFGEAITARGLGLVVFVESRLSPTEGQVITGMNTVAADSSNDIMRAALLVHTAGESEALQKKVLPRFLMDAATVLLADQPKYQKGDAN